MYMIEIILLNQSKLSSLGFIRQMPLHAQFHVTLFDNFNDISTFTTTHYTMWRIHCVIYISKTFWLIRKETKLITQMTPIQQFFYIFLHIINMHSGLRSIYWKEVEKTIGFVVRAWNSDVLYVRQLFISGWFSSLCLKLVRVWNRVIRLDKLVVV